MYKELIITLIILVSIFFLDYITQRYTDSAVSEITEEIRILEKDIKKEDVDKKKIFEDVGKTYEKWLEHHDILAYFIEHNELEKVETDFVAGKSYIESEQYYDALSELDKTVFVLEHINEKYSFNLENIF